MAAVTFTAGRFYECLDGVFVPADDVENWGNVCLHIDAGTYLLCEEIVFRKGARGRGLYAKLRVKRQGPSGPVIAYHRVSRNRIGSGSWDELNIMEVLAVASDFDLD